MKNLFFIVAALAVAAVVSVVLSSKTEDAENQVGVTATLNGISDKTVETIKEKLATAEGDERPVAKEVGPWPKAVAKSVDYDFGRMQVKTQLDHTFTIRNDGEATLNLKAGQSTCKCTAFTLSKTSVEPGDFAELFIHWEGKFNDERFSHGGPVYTDDPDMPEIRFVVHGAVDDPVKVLPEGLWDAGTVTDSAAGTFKAIICSKVFDDFKITEIKSNSPYIETSVEPLTDKVRLEVDALAGFFVNVKVLPDMPPGLLEEKLEITLDCLKDSPVIVDVTAQKNGAITVLNSPDALWVASSSGIKLGQFSAAKGRNATLMLMVQTKGMTEPLQISDVEASPGFLKASLEFDSHASHEMDRYKLLLSVPPGIPPRTSRDGSNPGTLKLQLNHPSGQVLQLKVAFSTF